MAHYSSLSPCAQMPTSILLAQTPGLKFQRPPLYFPFTSKKQLRQQRAITSPVTALLGSTSNAVTIPANPDKGMKRWHEMVLKVRDYELDQYGVVNNAVYSSYIQLGHQELFERIVGTNADAFTESTGAVMALTGLSLKFLAPLKSGDTFVLKVRLSETSAARMYFEHMIFKLPNKQPILEANTTAVYLDKNYRPIRIPPEARTKFNEFISGGENTQCSFAHLDSNILA